MSSEHSSVMEAADVFLRRIMHRAYEGAVEAVEMMLQRGPSGRDPSPDRAAMHEWYQGLDSETRERISFLARETARLAVFGCLVVLDNQTGGYPVQGQLSDYALYLQTYTDAHSQASNSAQTAVRLNPAHAADDDLHDKFLFILRKNEE